MISQGEFIKIIPTICSAETSSEPNTWSIDNPLYGHCVPVSLLAQDFFGGSIFRVPLEDTDYSKLRSHFLNQIDGEFIDFSKDQFKKHTPYNLDQAAVRNREDIISQGNTFDRYNILKEKFLNKIR